VSTCAAELSGQSQLTTPNRVNNFDFSVSFYKLHDDRGISSRNTSMHFALLDVLSDDHSAALPNLFPDFVKKTSNFLGSLSIISPTRKLKIPSKLPRGVQSEVVDHGVDWITILRLIYVLF
jgi:hypothetical protein